MIKFATEADKNKIIALWIEIFGDSRESVEQFLQYFPCEQALGYYVDGELVSFMFLPQLKIKYGDKEYKTNYVYALCTDPNFRSRGYANAIIKFSAQYSEQSGIDYTLIRPSGESLFDYYSAFGFEKEYRRIKKNLTIDSDLLYNNLDSGQVALAEWGSDGEGCALSFGIEEDVYRPCSDNLSGERYLMIRRNRKDAVLFDCVYMGLTFE
ncbi:MAG: GNAT family N-acetyltransferase [Clostridia bacterium]|nr:GNAT family N-acetyltransferase [Clostridia bacterium]